MTDLPLALDHNGEEIGLDHVGGNDVFGEGGRIVFVFLLHPIVTMSFPFSLSVTAV